MIGTGSTADAARLERATGVPLHGSDHLNNKAPQYQNALNNWLRRNPGASSVDRQAAQDLLTDLTNSTSGK